MKDQETKISRREFLRLSLIYPAAATVALGKGVPFDLNSEILNEKAKNYESGKDIELKIPADRVAVIKYRYPGYKVGDTGFPEEVFEAQTDLLEESKMKTLKDKELANFIEGGFVPSNSVALRIDQGSEHFDEFSGMVETLDKKGLHAMVFLSSGDDYTAENWDSLVKWYRKGTISIGSNSHSYTRLDSVNREKALWEAKQSKELIEDEFKKRGEKIEIIGFSFPYDKASSDISFLKEIGYKFALGGNFKGFTGSSEKGDFLLPSVCPYVSNSLLKRILVNSRISYRSVPTVSGCTFDNLIYFASTSVSLEKIEGQLKEEYPQVFLGDKFTPLPVDAKEKNLVKPRGIILHTDDQCRDDTSKWVTEGTYWGLKGRDTNVHFAVGLDGVNQFLPLYPDFSVPTRGGIGFSNYIQIEMCGRDYSRIIDGEYKDKNLNEAVDTVTEKALNLVVAIIEQYGIKKEKILGHHQASASGKTDPGQAYMDLFLKKLDGRLDKNLKEEKKTSSNWDKIMF